MNQTIKDKAQHSKSILQPIIEIGKTYPNYGKGKLQVEKLHQHNIICEENSNCVYVQPV